MHTDMGTPLLVDDEGYVLIGVRQHESPEAPDTKRELSALRARWEAQLAAAKAAAEP